MEKTMVDNVISELTFGTERKIAFGNGTGITCSPSDHMTHGCQNDIKLLAANMVKRMCMI